MESLSMFAMESNLDCHSVIQRFRTLCGITLGEVGYYVGVRVWEQPDVNASPTGYYQDTITAFNISANTWSNTLKTSIGTEGTIQGASIGTISALGLDKRGLLVLIGGKDPMTNVSDAYYGFSHYFNFSNITIYDPYIDVWYAQTATGDIPGVRESFCMATMQGDNGTYEM